VGRSIVDRWVVRFFQLGKVKRMRREEEEIEVLQK